MIVGNGLLASAFDKRQVSELGATVFASGVSNSDENDPAAFLREESLLTRHLEDASGPFVYFSTCSITDPDKGRGHYAQHKARMEDKVRTRPDSLILRLPQVVGRTSNPNTLANFIARHIADGTELTVWRNALRCLVDVDHVAGVAVHLLSQSSRLGTTQEVAPPETVTMPALVAMMEKVMHRKANVRIVDRTGGMTPDPTLMIHVAPDIGIDISPGYNLRLLQKYYGPTHAI
jgi:nucleoside-diphosphate-sugar epimerase